MSKADDLKRRMSSKRSNPNTQNVEQAVNTAIHESVDTGTQVKKKKATFDLDPEFHKRLKIFAAENGQNMVDVIVKAVDEYIGRQNQ